jgi:hypothetical protein
MALVLRFFFRHTTFTFTTFTFAFLDAVGRTRVMLAPVGVTSTIAASPLAVLGGIGLLVILVIGHNAMSNTDAVRALGLFGRTTSR